MNKQYRQKQTEVYLNMSTKKTRFKMTEITNDILPTKKNDPQTHNIFTFFQITQTILV